MASPMVQVNVRLTPELHAALEQAAQRGGGSVSDVIRTALRAYLRGKGKTA